MTAAHAVSQLSGDASTSPWRIVWARVSSTGRVRTGRSRMNRAIARTRSTSNRIVMAEIMPRGHILPTVAGLPTYIDILPVLWETAEMLEDVVVLALPGVAPFELGVVCEVF